MTDSEVGSGGILKGRENIRGHGAMIKTIAFFFITFTWYYYDKLIISCLKGYLELAISSIVAIVANTI